MASMDVPADRPVAVPKTTARVAQPTYITWLTLAFMTTASVASLRSAPTMAVYGLTCDNLMAADVVTADGRLVHASAEKNPDLLWGLRGGSSNFGIVTNFEFQLHPVGPMVLAGMLIHMLDNAKDVARALKEYKIDAEKLNPIVA